MELTARKGSDPHNQAQIYNEHGRTVAITYSDEKGRLAKAITLRFNLHDRLKAAAENLANAAGIAPWVGDPELKRLLLQQANEARIILDEIKNQ